MPDFSTLACRLNYRDIAKNTTPYCKERKFPSTSVPKRTFLYFTIVMVVTAMTPVPIDGLSKFSHRTKINSVRRIRSAALGDLMQNARFLTARTTITVQGRDQERHLTVFQTSTHGYVEFGFPPTRHRPQGSLEILDITSSSTTCCPSGVRKVVISHSCSNLYLTADKYGQARACQYTASGRRPVYELSRNSHCISGHKFHSCDDIPHVFLDSIPAIYASNVTRSESAHTDRIYKLRLEKPGDKTRHKKIMYAVVTRNTWEMKTRSQNSIIKRAVGEACHQLWQKSIHILFQRTAEKYRAYQRESNPNLARVCNINPSAIETEISQSLHPSDFIRAVQQEWRNTPVAKLIGTSVAWSLMSDTYRNVISVVASRIVRRYLMDSLLHAANTNCLNNSRWGRMSRKDRQSLLERNLSISWLQRRVGSRQIVMHNIEKFLDLRTTSFIINEHG